MVLVCNQCTNYKNVSKVSDDFSLEDCLRFCSGKKSTECLGVTVGRENSQTKRQCWEITELTKDGWKISRSNKYFDTWKKGSNVSIIVSHVFMLYYYDCFWFSYQSSQFRYVSFV